jgi:hypothetical protein
MTVAHSTCACRVARRRGGQRAYNEEAFACLLAVERRRAERCGRPFMVMLVDRPRQSGSRQRWTPRQAADLFAALWQCLRESDAVGWFRDGLVLGAIIDDLPGPAEPAVRDAILARVTRAMPRALQAAPCVRVRLYRVQRPAGGRPVPHDMSRHRATRIA